MVGQKTIISFVLKMNGIVVECTKPHIELLSMRGLKLLIPSWHDMRHIRRLNDFFLFFGGKGIIAPSPTST